jgi:hypothetical protein
MAALRKIVRQSGTGIAVLGLAFCLQGCGESHRGIVAARWVKPDTSLVVTEGESTESHSLFGSDMSWRFWVHYVELAGERRVLLSVEDAVPCGPMLYQRSDSLLFLTYVGRKGYGGDPCGGGSGLLWAGKFSASGWTAGPSVDSALLRNRLQEVGEESQLDSGISIEASMYDDRLCVSGHGCMSL